MTAEIRTFRALANTQNTAVTTSSQAVEIAYSLGTRSVRFSNIGTQTVFIAFGDSTVTASTATSMPLQAGNTEVFTIGKDITHYAVIAPATGSTIYVTIGEGL